MHAPATLTKVKVGGSVVDTDYKLGKEIGVKMLLADFRHCKHADDSTPILCLVDERRGDGGIEVQ